MTATLIEIEFASIADRLRKIADDIDNGKHPAESATLVLDTEIIGLGTNDNNPVGVLWDLSAAQHKIMAVANGSYKYGKL